MSDEDEIAAKLAERVAEPELPSAPELPEETTEPEAKEDDAFHSDLRLETFVDKMKLQDYFEIPLPTRRSAEVELQINKIMEWAQTEAKSREYADILRVINDQERILGTKLKDNRLLRMYQYVNINTQRKRLAEQERALYA